MTSEEILKNYICERYMSIRNFAVSNNLKYSTVTAILSRGLRNSNVDNVFEICKALGISSEELVERQLIVEYPVKPMKKSLRRIEAYYIFLSAAANGNQIVIDDKPLTDDELDIMLNGIDCIVDLIKRLRKKNKEEN